MASPTEREEQIVGLLTGRGVPFRIHEHVVARTVGDATALLPFPVEQFLKTIVFRTKGGDWILVACRGQDRIDYKKLAAACGVRRDQLMRPAPEEVEVALGYAIGGICPIPPEEGMRAIVDATAVANLETVYCGVGRNDRTLEIAIGDLIAAAQARVAAVVQE